MPGQRKRKGAELRAAERSARLTAAGTGRWQVVFETTDEADWQARMSFLRAEERAGTQVFAGGERIDRELTRIDVLCGRLSYPTTYRLSLFVREPGAGPVGEPGGGAGGR